MTAPHRFLFDECIGRRAMLSLAALVGTPVWFEHLTVLRGSGDQDPDWIPVFAAEGGWVLITTDAGRQSKKTEKLPALCAIHGLTHLILSPTIHRLKEPNKVELLVQFWLQIERLHLAEPGTRFNLQYVTRKGRGIPTVAIVPSPP